MKWYELFEKNRNQEFSKMKKSDVVVLIDDKEIPLLVKFKSTLLSALFTYKKRRWW